MGPQPTCILSLLFVAFSSISWCDSTSNTSIFPSTSRVEHFFQLLHTLIPGHGDWDEVLTLKSAYLAERAAGVKYDPDSLPYFKFLPKYLLTATPGTQHSIPGTCFENAQLSSLRLESGAVEVSLDLGPKDSVLCHCGFLLATDRHLQLKEVWVPGHHKVTFPPINNSTPAEDWDLYQRGPRIFLYPISPEEVTSNLAATLALFEPCLTQGVNNYFADLNREFLSAFAGIDMEVREAPDILEVPAEMIKNGDTINIMRLDGLDPMIGWAMGASTGHTAIALWRGGQLQICESNAASPYWPINGVQCNPYPQWLQYGKRAGYNAVLAPLSKERSEWMNMSQAWQFVDSMRGVDYGYEVILTGLLDTLTDNLPCAGKDKSLCLEPEHLEMLITFLERVSTEAARILKPAIMQRAGVEFSHPSGVLEAYYQAHLQGLQPTHLPILPEKDGWKYPTTRDGQPSLSPVMICNVFVCNVWKAAGLFHDIKGEFNCGETSVNDNYRLELYSTEPPPSICTDVDPENPLCQILGRYHLRLDTGPGVLPRYNYIQPHKDMFEKCPSLAPEYLAPTQC